MKYWQIIADLGVIVMTAALAITSARAEPPPATIDCTFYRVPFPKYGDYSKTKVAPKDMAWIAGDHPYPRPDEIRTGLVVWDKNYRQWGLVVLGRGSGRLTPITDLPKLLHSVGKGGIRSRSERDQLSNISSWHGDTRSISADRRRLLPNSRTPTTESAA